ncbi:MAG: NfeD family protein [Deltaproteobacteria bacterium]|nr:NfeD family protein [Deltaproteobacteria bacterium]
MDLTVLPWLLWFLAGIAIMLAELAVPGFVILFFGVGCWGAAVVAVFAPESYSVQVAVFLTVAVISLITLRKVAMRVFVGRSEGPDTDDEGNVPKGARVTLEENLEAGRVGRVRFRGALWDAVSEERIPAGADAEIIGVDKTNRSCLRLKGVSPVFPPT